MSPAELRKVIHQSLFPTVELLTRKKVDDQNFLFGVLSDFRQDTAERVFM